MQTTISVNLPGWARDWLQGRSAPLSDLEAGMRLAIELAAENIRQGTGGPFGAVVMDPQTGALVGAGVNLVTSAGLSIAHAEMVALSLAQASEGDWNLARRRELALCTSCEPCAMCYGAIPWSGVRQVVVGAGKAEAEAAGFDEGDKPGDWQSALEARGIAVRTGVLYDEAARLFDQYRAAGGLIYNAGDEPG